MDKLKNLINWQDSIKINQTQKIKKMIFLFEFFSF